MMTITSLLLIIIFNLVKQSQTNAVIGSNSGSLYNSLKDDVEILNKTSFDTIYKADKAVFVEFYAHWCGACQRYAQHWKELAKETKSWHNKVIRVAAIDCADQDNDPVCREFNIEFYPTLKLFPAQSVKGVQPASLRSDKIDALITKMILFIENHEHKPVTWPEVEPYKSKRLDTMFLSPYHNCKFAFLIFEKNEVDEFGRKLILDFSEFTDRIAIRRIVSNPTLVNKLSVDTRSKQLPSVYLINNTNGMKTFEKFDQILVDKYAKNLGQKLEDDEQEKSLDDRKKYSKMIRQFIKLTEVISTAELENLDKNINAAQLHAEQVNRAEAQSYLTNMDNRIFMQDLESGLHLMLRNDIARLKLITGEKLKALKEWLRVLVKFFPGRKPVRNYLKQLYSKVNKTLEMTGTQWKLYSDESSVVSYLPTTIEWRHCKGSQEKYRGYPCSLWTLFHVLTVSQTEIEKAKQHPFEDGYNLSEIIEAIRLFVFNFFTCRECADNFRMETENYIRYLMKPYDAVQYLWTVHNNVNKRLAIEDTNDPIHPKILFPSKSQCPKCYLANVLNIQDLKDHESPWVTNEVLLFLTSFYSKYQIEGIRDLEIKESSNKTNPLDTLNDSPKFYDYEDDKKLVIDTNNNNSQMKRQAKRLTSIEGFVDVNDADLKESFFFGFKNNIFIFCVILLGLFFSFYLYFNYRKKSFKLKKHLI